MPRRLRSISLPIVLTAVALGLSVALLVGWTLIMAELEGRGQVTLLVVGIVSFVVIMTVLVTSAVLLVREILEGRRQTSFLDSVTHELKSPLASLHLCLETLGRDGLTGPQRQSVRDMMTEDVERLSVFIDDILTANRLAGDRRTLEVIEVPVREAVEHCVERVKERHHLSDDRIRIEVEESLGVATDRTAFEIILTNLLDNAVKYSDETEPVVVAARPQSDGSTLIEVRDNGIGIARRHLKQIFRRFFRVDSEEVRERRGTGLGLFVVWGLVRRLGGRLKAESGGRGTGTVVRVLLPARAQDVVAQ